MAASTKVSRPKLLKYTEEALQAACQAVLQEKKKLREAARLHGVPPSTLKDRIKGRKPFHEVQRTVITAGEEERLVAWIKESARRGFGRTMNQVQCAVQGILNSRKAVTVFRDNLPGRKWVSLFMRRHPDVTLRTPQALGSQRAAVTEAKVRGWFEAALKEIKAAGGDVLDHPSRIFNCDESGFQLGGGGFSKVLANKGDKRVYQVSTDTHTQITVLACGSASGEMQKPLIIFPGQRFSYDPLEGFPEAHFAKSNNGWIDGDIFSTWLETAFIPAVAHLPKPVVLFADGHRTHLTLTVSELCRDHGIILYLLPSHSSHLVQPLDLTTFKLLKQTWREEVMKFQEVNCDTIGKKEFAGVFRKAWKRGIKKDAVISGFRAAGLYPWNPDHVDMTKLGPARLYGTQTETGPVPEETETGPVPGTSQTETETGPVPGTSLTETETGPVPGTSQTETETGPVPGTSQTETETGPVPGTSQTVTRIETGPTETEYMTDTESPFAFETVTVTADETLTKDIDVSTSSPAPPPPTALPLLSSSPLATSSSSSSPRVLNSLIAPVPSSTSSSHYTTSSSAAPSSFSSFPDNVGTKEALDRLLDVTAKIGSDGLVRYRTLHSLGIETDDPEERLFCLLYSKLITPPKTGTSQERTFDNLPLPSRWTHKKRQNLQPPKMISSDAYRQFVADIEDKKKKTEEDKERKKKEREEKKKVNAEKKKEQERKKKEREEKKAEREKQKALKGKQTKKTKGKRRVTVDNDDTSDNDSMTSSKCVDNNIDIDMTNDDNNVCFVCAGEKDDDYSDWIGCDECKRWFHIACLEDESLRGKSMNEIKRMNYVCYQCKK